MSTNASWVLPEDGRRADMAPRSGGLLHRLVRRATPELGTPPLDVGPPPSNRVDPESAKTALEQVNKRLDAQLSIKTSTEARAVALAGSCVTVLTAVVAAGLIEVTGAMRPELVAAAVVATVFLLAAVGCAYRAIDPQAITLPGRLPSDLWDDLTDDTFSKEQFTLYMIAGLQRAMVGNERLQGQRAHWLRRSLRAAVLSVPAALVAAAVARRFWPTLSAYLLT